MSHLIAFNPPPIKFKLINWIKENIVLLSILAIIVTVIYANSVNNAFVSDDLPAILNNPLIGTSKFISVNFYRYPAQKLAHTASFIIGGKNPVYFRIPVILTHFFNAVLIFLILEVLKNKRVGYIAALIFAVHPLLSEAVVWISAGPYVYSTFFTLLSFLLYFFGKQNRRLVYLSLLSFIVAFNFFAFAICLPFLLIAFEFANKKLKDNWRKTIPYFALLGVGVILYTLVFSLRVSYLSLINNQGLLTRNPLTHIPSIISTYIELFLWPQNLTLYHSDLGFSLLGFSTITFTKTALALKFVVTIIFVASITITYIKDRFVFFWLLFFIISIAITLTPLSITWTVAERYIYLGSIGIIVVIAYLLDKLIKNKELLNVVVLIIVVVLGVRTMVRNTNWKTADTLWLSAAKISPSSHQNRNNLGDLYSRRGDYDRAIKEFETAILLKPNYSDAMHNLAALHLTLGNVELAKQFFEKSVQIKPLLWQSHMHLGDIYLKTGELENAEKSITASLQINQANPNGIAILALIESAKGNEEKAVQLIQEALQIDPNNQIARKFINEPKNIK